MALSSQEAAPLEVVEWRLAVESPEVAGRTRAEERLEQEALGLAGLLAREELAVREQADLKVDGLVRPERRALVAGREGQTQQLDRLAGLLAWEEPVVREQVDLKVDGLVGPVAEQAAVASGAGLAWEAGTARAESPEPAAVRGAAERQRPTRPRTATRFVAAHPATGATTVATLLLAAFVCLRQSPAPKSFAVLMGDTRCTPATVVVRARPAPSIFV